MTKNARAHPNAPVLRETILTERDEADIHGSGQFDVVVGSSPCVHNGGKLV